jgi:hypothetical protein
MTLPAVVSTPVTPVFIRMIESTLELPVLFFANLLKGLGMEIVAQECRTRRCICVPCTCMMESTLELPGFAFLDTAMRNIVIVASLCSVSLATVQCFTVRGAPLSALPSTTKRSSYQSALFSSAIPEPGPECADDNAHAGMDDGSTLFACTNIGISRFPLPSGVVGLPATCGSTVLRVSSRDDAAKYEDLQHFILHEPYFIVTRGPNKLCWSHSCLL